MSKLWVQPSKLSEPAHESALFSCQIASEVLTQLSGGMYRGEHEITELYDTRLTLRPRVQTYPMMIRGQMFNCTDGTCACSRCGITHRIRLRGQPARHVLEVRVAGKLVDPMSYMLLDHSTLAFTADADVCSSTCITVRYTYGQDPPALGQFAALKLANQILASYPDTSETCRLPSRVTSVTRQGMTMSMLDPQDFLDDGRVGIYEVDLFLKTFNPAHALKRARIFSPDRQRAQTALREYPVFARVVQPDDLAVIPGEDAGWYIGDPGVLRAAENDDVTLTLSINGYPDPFVVGTSVVGTGVVITIPSEVTKYVGNNASWELKATSSDGIFDETLLTGEAKTL